MINLFNSSPVEYDNFKEIFKFKISFNIPKITTLNNCNKLVLIYENNQICIIDFNPLNVSSNNIEKDKNIINTNEAIIKNNIKEINIKSIGPLIPKAMKYSEVYSSSYGPSNLFTKTESYYCSSSNEPQHFIQLDF